MAQDYEYKCHGCGKETSRELLTVKKVMFLEMGVGGKPLRSRVVSWLCPPCVKADPAWHIPAHQHPDDRPMDLKVVTVGE